MNYPQAELEKILGAVGENVHIHRSVQFFSPKTIHLGSNVRIDCFCVLSAGLKGIYVGDHVHLAAGVYLMASGGRLDIESFSGLSSRVVIFTASDDYSGGYMTNPTIPERFRNVTTADVVVKKHSIIGSGSVVMPGVTLGVACSVGALSFVNKSVPGFTIVSGNPLKLIGKRDPKILELEKEFLK